MKQWMTKDCGPRQRLETTSGAFLMVSSSASVHEKPRHQSNYGHANALLFQKASQLVPPTLYIDFPGDELSCT
ncbi:hypothetical protein OPV22_026857 [Ensete ventricosum]|uniref:Uncharacterized protein n=1 Tax=Ensete ventricosum TaxID=4639 RepID=A0AAV8PYA7_ENSVE|nr:hypothetical protein OPV22_026857 [Ensete ventricosum]